MLRDRSFGPVPAAHSTVSSSVSELPTGRITVSISDPPAAKHSTSGSDEGGEQNGDCILECVQLDALVTVGGQMGASSGGDVPRSAPIAISPRRTSLRPGVEVLSPEALWSRTPPSPSSGSFDPSALRVAELVTRPTSSSPPSDCGDHLFSLNYHVSVPLPEPVRLASLPPNHRFLIELQCTRTFPLGTEHVYVSSTPRLFAARLPFWSI